jgi:hypothetical protein
MAIARWDPSCGANGVPGLRTDEGDVGKMEGSHVCTDPVIDSTISTRWGTEDLVYAPN